LFSFSRRQTKVLPWLLNAFVPSLSPSDPLHLRPVAVGFDHRALDVVLGLGVELDQLPRSEERQLDGLDRRIPVRDALLVPVLELVALLRREEDEKAKGRRGRHDVILDGVADQPEQGLRRPR
jgi:hypothetical protein